MCNTSLSAGYSQVIQYHFLSSPCANRQGWRGTVSRKAGEGMGAFFFVSVIMCTDKRPASRGKQMRWALELLVQPGLIHLCVHACLHTTCVELRVCDLSLTIDRENALCPLPCTVISHCLSVESSPGRNSVTSSGLDDLPPLTSSSDRLVSDAKVMLPWTVLLTQESFAFYCWNKKWTWIFFWVWRSCDFSQLSDILYVW